MPRSNITITNASTGDVTYLADELFRWLHEYDTNPDIMRRVKKASTRQLVEWASHDILWVRQVPETEVIKLMAEVRRWHQIPPMDDGIKKEGQPNDSNR
jgi:hypothetical protein